MLVMQLHLNEIIQSVNLEYKKTPIIDNLIQSISLQTKEKQNYPKESKVILKH